MSIRDMAIAELKTAPELVAQEALDFIVFLKMRKPAPAGTDALGYPAGSFEATAGSFADEPLERPAQPPLDPVPA